VSELVCNKTIMLSIKSVGYLTILFDFFLVVLNVLSSISSVAKRGIGEGELR